MYEYSKSDQRADLLRPQVNAVIEFLREPNRVDHPALQGDGETIFATILVATGRRMGLGWKMDTVRDQVEMAKISVAYLMEGGTNASWVLDIFETALKGYTGEWAATSASIALQPEVEEVLDVQRAWLDGEVADPPASLDEILAAHTEEEVIAAAFKRSPKLTKVAGVGMFAYLAAAARSMR